MSSRWVGLITAGLALTAFVLMLWLAVGKGLNFGIAIRAEHYIAVTSVAGAATWAFTIAEFWPRSRLALTALATGAMAMVFVIDEIIGVFGGLGGLAVYAGFAALLSCIIGLVNAIRLDTRRSAT